MNRKNQNIKSNSAKAYLKMIRNGSEDDMLLNREDSSLMDSIRQYMKGRLDLEEVRNDPALPVMDSEVKKMIVDYNKNKAKNKNDEKLIRDIFAGGVSDEKLLDEISHIKYEINNTKVNDISAEWVKEWHEKRQKIGAPDIKTEEIRNFVKDSFESENKEIEKIGTDIRKKGLVRSLLFRYISLSAAAVIGLFILVKTLIPSYDSGKLFNSYYEPMSVISHVTRSGNTSESDIYAQAIESYKLGDYQTAAIGFSSALLKDPSNIESSFFLGITQLALGNYNQSINLLSEVTAGSGDHGKEARWYLGLAYLKTSQIDKAAVCFKILSQSPGYYSHRSEKILRRLK